MTGLEPDDGVRVEEDHARRAFGRARSIVAMNSTPAPGDQPHVHVPASMAGSMYAIRDGRDRGARTGAAIALTANRTPRRSMTTVSPCSALSRTSASALR